MKLNSTLLIILSFCVIVLSLNCKKTEKTDGKEVVDPVVTQGVIPTVQTESITSITTVSAMGGGITLTNGSSAVTDRGLVLALKTQPTIADTKFGTVSVSGSGTFTSELKDLKPNTKYFLRAFATNKTGTGYGNELTFTTNSIGNANFTFKPLFIIGATTATCDIEITNDGGDQVTERGLVYGVVENPTITNNKLKHNNIGTGKYRLMLKDLQEKTSYYVRAYAINAKGVSYSENVTFKTIAKGKITYTFNKVANPTAEQLAAYDRLQVAIDSAVWYLSNYTSATKHVWLNYVEGTPTADANNEGWMRFGTGTGYQNLRTMLHEMNHTFGTGTTTWWTGKIVGGKFQGTNTNELLNKIQNSTGAQLSGDAQHWWPYGLNQNSEVTSSWDYVYNCILIEAMRKDGQTHSGAL
jgi:hypothetical protein